MKKIKRSLKQNIWVNASFIISIVMKFAGVDLRDKELVRLLKLSAIHKASGSLDEFLGITIDITNKNGYNNTSESGGEDV